MREEPPSRPEVGATSVESTPRALLGECGSRGGWLVTFAAAGTGLVLGVLYIRSVVKGGIPASRGWSQADMALPYSIMCAAFRRPCRARSSSASWSRERFSPRSAGFWDGRERSRRRPRAWALTLTDGRRGGLEVFKNGETCRLAGPAEHSSEVAT
jgi:hypothetical protein